MKDSNEPSKTQDFVSGKTSVCFENEDIKVIHYQGSSDFLVVTFGDLLSPANGNSFFADSVMQRKDLNCIGFMSKRPNWYPKQSMQLAMYSIAEILLKFPSVITYGGSMGGYAAIKYSGLLNASAILALCPQWTIDPNECEGMNPGYRSFYNESMEGMGVKPNDVSGKLFLFYDSQYKEDAYHGACIRKIFKNHCYVPMPSVEHHVTRVLSGSENLLLLLQSALKDDRDTIVSVASMLRRSSVQRSRAVVFRSLKNHPFLLHNMIIGKTDLSFLGASEKESIYSSLLEKFIALARVREAIESIDYLMELGFCEERKTLLRAAKCSLEMKACEVSPVLSHNGSMLAYNIARGCLVQHSLTTSSCIDILIKPVTVTSNGEIEQLSINAGGKNRYLLLDNGKVIIVDAIIAMACKEKTLVIKRILSKDRFNVRIGGSYLTCEPSGSIKFDRTEAKGWEEFSILQVSR